jgi:hypothetical protein
MQNFDRNRRKRAPFVPTFVFFRCPASLNLCRLNVLSLPGRKGVYWHVTESSNREPVCIWTSPPFIVCDAAHRRAQCGRLFDERRLAVDLFG